LQLPVAGKVHRKSEGDEQKTRKWRCSRHLSSESKGADKVVQMLVGLFTLEGS